LGYLRKFISAKGYLRKVENHWVSPSADKTAEKRFRGICPEFEKSGPNVVHCKYDAL
jgi:hypothetical protein